MCFYGGLSLLDNSQYFFELTIFVPQISVEGFGQSYSYSYKTIIIHIKFDNLSYKFYSKDIIRYTVQFPPPAPVSSTGYS